MALRPIHNRIAKIVTGYSNKLIDTTNKEIDAPSQTHPGMPHRQWFHSTDPLRSDTMQIHKGDPRKLIVQRIHIVVDTDPAFKKVAKVMQISEDIKKMRRK